MSNIIPFQFNDNSIRVNMHADGEPWFNAGDVCKALGFWNPRQAIESHVDKDDVQKLDTLTLGGKQSVNHINESGLYSLIFGSTKESAKTFKRWVTKEVLPSIRKTGSFGQTQKHTPTRLPDKVRAIIEIGKFMKGLKGINPSVLHAATLETIRINTEIDTVPIAKAIPNEELENIANLNATEVGKRVDLKGRGVNLLLSQLGLIYRDDHRDWRLTEAGTAFGEIKPFHKNCHTGYEIRWKESVIDVLLNHLTKTCDSKVTPT